MFNKETIENIKKQFTSGTLDQSVGNVTYVPSSKLYVLDKTGMQGGELERIKASTFSKQFSHENTASN